MLVDVELETGLWQRVNRPVQLEVVQLDVDGMIQANKEVHRGDFDSIAGLSDGVLELAYCLFPADQHAGVRKACNMAKALRPWSNQVHFNSDFPNFQNSKGFMSDNSALMFPSAGHLGDTSGFASQTWHTEPIYPSKPMFPPGAAIPSVPVFPTTEPIPPAATTGIAPGYMFDFQSNPISWPPDFLFFQAESSTSIQPNFSSSDFFYQRPSYSALSPNDEVDIVLPPFSSNSAPEAISFTEEDDFVVAPKRRKIPSSEMRARTRSGPHLSNER